MEELINGARVRTDSVQYEVLCTDKTLEVGPRTIRNKLKKVLVYL